VQRPACTSASDSLSNAECFVQNQDGGVLQERPGNGDALAFSSGKDASPFSPMMVSITFWQPLDKVMRQSDLGCFHHRVQRNAGWP